MTAVSPIHAFVGLYLNRTFVWGTSDCCTFMADWLAVLHGRDVMAGLRGTYSTVGECQRATRFLTEPVTVTAAVLAPLALDRVTVARPGDVGLALTPFEGRAVACGAICLDGDLWAARKPGGTHIAVPPRLIAIWGARWDGGPVNVAPWLGLITGGLTCAA